MIWPATTSYLLHDICDSLSVIRYLWFAICYFFPKLTINCKNLFLLFIVVRLIVFFIWDISNIKDFFSFIKYWPKLSLRCSGKKVTVCYSPLFVGKFIGKLFIEFSITIEYLRYKQAYFFDWPVQLWQFNKVWGCIFPNHHPLSENHNFSRTGSLLDQSVNSSLSVVVQ